MFGCGLIILLFSFSQHAYLQLKIQKDSEVLLRVVGTRVDATEIVRIRTYLTKSSPKVEISLLLRLIVSIQTTSLYP